MKPPNIKAPKCTLYSFIIQGQRSQGLNGLATAHCEHCWGQLTSESHFESLRAAEAKNAATINHLMSKRQSVLHFPNSTLNLALYSNKLIVIITSCTTGPYLASIHTVYNVLHMYVVVCTRM